MLVTLLAKFSSPLWKVCALLAVALALWGHGYYTAYQYWDNWYDAKVEEQNKINKEAEAKGLKEAERLKQEEQKDEDILKQNEQESQNDPNRDTPALSRDSVQRLNRL